MRKYTIIINTYPNSKRKRELTRTLESIYKQTHTNFEILIVENYKDTSKITDILDKFKQRKQKIKIISDPTKRLSYLFNLGWKNAKTDYLGYVADDVEVEKDWLANIDTEFKRNQKIGVVTGPIISTCFPASEMHRLYLITQRNAITRFIAWPYLYFAMENQILKPGMLFESGAYSIGAGLKESKTYKKQEIDLATTSSMGIRREILKKINGFDETFSFNHADGDIFIRIKKIGYKIIFTPKVVAYHHVRIGPSRNAYFIGKDTGIFYKKHIRPKSVKGVIGAMLNILTLNIFWIYNAIRTKQFNQLEGILGFFKGLIV